MKEQDLRMLKLSSALESFNLKGKSAQNCVHKRLISAHTPKQEEYYKWGKNYHKSTDNKIGGIDCNS